MGPVSLANRILEAMTYEWQSLKQLSKKTGIPAKQIPYIISWRLSPDKFEKKGSKYRKRKKDDNK